MPNDSDRRVISVPNSSHTVARNVSEYLKRCFPQTDQTIIEANLLEKRYDMYYLVDSSTNILGILAAKLDPGKNEVYLTHACKTRSNSGKKVFEKMFKKVKEVYGENIRYYMKVRGDNKEAIKAFKRQNFRKRLNSGFILKDYSYYIIMNSTKRPEQKAYKIAKEFRVGQSVTETGFDIVSLRRALIDVTAERWFEHKLKWQRSKSSDKHMHMIYGNLAITMFIAINQYLTTPIRNTQLYIEELNNLSSLSPENISKIGANYYQNQNGKGKHKTNNRMKPTTRDIFRFGVYDMTFKELKKLARQQFDKMYTPIKEKLEMEVKRNELTPKLILNTINKNFQGGDGEKGLSFFGHNMGMYQYLAMIGFNQ